VTLGKQLYEDNQYTTQSSPAAGKMNPPAFVQRRSPHITNTVDSTDMPGMFSIPYQAKMN